MLRILRTSTLALAGALLILAGCAAPTQSKPATDTTPKPLPAEPNGGTPVWARTNSDGAARSTSSGTTTDQEGNVYAVGYLYGAGTYDFGNEVEVTIVDAEGTAHLYLVKYNAEGTAQWVKTTVSSVRSSYFTSVTTDLDGNVYAAGYVYSGALDLGDGVTLNPTVSGEGVLVKYDGSGKTLWARTLVGAESESPRDRTLTAVVVDATSVYVAGYAGNEEYPLVARYSTSGTFAWEQTVTEMPDDDFGRGQFNGLVTDGSGNLFAAGLFSKATGDFVLPLLARFDSSGAEVWKKTAAATATSLYSGFNALALVSGNLYAAGYVQNYDAEGPTFSFGNDVSVAAPASGAGQAVLVKYDTSGQAQWIQAPGGDGSYSYESRFNALTVDGDGNIYAGGWLYDAGETYDFGNDLTVPMENTGRNLFAFVRYDSTGAAQWVRTPTSQSASFELSSMAIAPSGAIVFAGVLKTGAISLAADITATSTNGSGTALLVRYE